MANRKSFCGIQWHHSGPYGVTSSKGCGFPISGNRSEVNRAMKVKSDVRLPRTRTLIPCRKFFLRGGWEDGALESNFSKLPELFETSRARKLIFGVQVNIDKANSRRYHVIR